MSGNRVEKLESRVEELEASVSGLTEELMQTKARLAEVEEANETDAAEGYIEAGVGSVTEDGSNESSDANEDTNSTEHETENNEPPEADDIIVA